MTKLKTMSRLILCGLLTWALAWQPQAIAFAAPDPESHPVSYRVLNPIESGSVTLYPIIRTHVEEKAAHWHYLTLDQGLKSGDVVITEAGKARGLACFMHEGSRSGVRGPRLWRWC